jgi:hypothetical protein
MCFSATASFTAGTVLSAIGVVTVTKAERPSEVPFAMIPLLFGVQQLIEGVVWLTFGADAPQLTKLATYTYSVFSHVLFHSPFGHSRPRDGGAVQWLGFRPSASRSVRISCTSW